ncbi:MAG: hypothetical protein ACYTFO_05715 [Planctomycetota bacterium]|jgi:hypothetical protein
MVTITLTPDQVEHVKSEGEGVGQLTDEQVKEIVRRLREELDEYAIFRQIPDDKKELFLERFVRGADYVLYTTLPQDLYAAIQNAHHGKLDDDEIKQLAKALIDHLIRVLPLPWWVPEDAVKGIVTLFVRLILDALPKGKELNTVLGIVV